MQFVNYPFADDITRLMMAVRKHIAHLDLDCFFVSVERINDPSLQGKPVIVGGSPSGRGVVASASYEARAYGVRSAMPTSQALRLCPNAIVVRGHYEAYADYSHRLYQRMLEVAPVVERASIDEMYLDLTGCEGLYHHDLPGFIRTLQQTIADEFSLPCTIALASNKLIAKIAANTVKPNGVIYIPAGTEKQFLSAYSIEVIPGIGAKTAEVLRGGGFRIIADLQSSSRVLLTHILGSYGDYLFDAAQGIGSDTVRMDRIRKSISREETFQHDICDIRELEKVLFLLTEDVCSTLRSYHWKTRTVSLKLRYTDFTTITRRRTIAPTHYDPDIFTTVNELFHAAFDRKTPARLLGVGLSHFIGEDVSTISLFDFPDKKNDMLNAVDKLRKKFGDRVLHIGSA